MSDLYQITLTAGQKEAIASALLLGALNERQATLRLLIAHNQDHVSLANSYERELEELRQAASLIANASRA